MKKKTKIIFDAIVLALWLAVGIMRLLTPGDVPKISYFGCWAIVALFEIFVLLGDTRSDFGVKMEGD